MKDINKVVAEMRDEGVLDQIYEKYGLDPSFTLLQMTRRIMA